VTQDASQQGSLSSGGSQQGSLPPDASLSGSLLLVLGRPRWWLLALAAFLVRGGIIVMFLPIIILPTPSGVANVFGPAVTGLALGGAGAELIALIAILAVGATVALVAGNVLGAWFEATLVGEIIDDADGDGLAWPAEIPPGRVTEAPAWRGATVRLVAHLPLVLALVWGIPTVIEAGYAELVLPGELVTPLAIRIAARVPVTVALILGAWLVGEVVGGLALRRLMRGANVPRALIGATGSVIRRPVSSIGLLVRTQVAFLLLLVPALLGSGAGWDRVRILLTDGIATTADQLGLVLALVGFIGLWLGGYVLVGLGAAVRAVAWTTWAADRWSPGTVPTGAVPG